MINNYLSHFLPVLLALDLIIPFLLAPFYKDYNHLTQVMSVLGNSKAPLHSIYNIWLVVFGVAILLKITRFSTVAIFRPESAAFLNRNCWSSCIRNSTVLSPWIIMATACLSAMLSC